MKKEVAAAADQAPLPLLHLAKTKATRDRSVYGVRHCVPVELCRPQLIASSSRTQITPSLFTLSLGLLACRPF